MHGTVIHSPGKQNSPSDVFSDFVSPVGSPNKTSRTRNCHTPEANRKRAATIAAKRAARLTAAKLAREAEIKATVEAGGIYYGESDRLVTFQGREAQVHNGRNVAAWKARQALESNWLATLDLPVPAEGVRSKGEDLAMRMIRWKAPESIVAHSESLHGDGVANDRSITFNGKDTLKVRDLEWWLSTDELYHLQVKGTASWYYRFKASLDLRERDPFAGYRRFTLLRSELLNTLLYAATNDLLVSYCTEETVAVLPMLFLDYRHIREWFEYYLTEASLLEKFRFSDLFVRRQLKRILKRAFPKEYKLIKRAIKIFERRIPNYEEHERSMEGLLSLFRFSLFQAGQEHSFDRSLATIDEEFRSLDWNTLFPKRKRRQKAKKLTKSAKC